MPADFLLKYPEFRGEAPQLEPSPTFCTSQDVDKLEIIYWRLMREKFRRGQDDSEVSYCQYFTLPIDGDDQASTRRRLKPRLAIKDLLNSPVTVPQL
ncbi:hypothetical protein ES702_01840 [subsurface metagenome]